jgi:hypothetical protein
LNKLQELEHHAGAALRIGGRPGREGSLGVADRLPDLCPARERDPGLNITGVGVKDIAETARCALYCFAADEMTDFTHPVFSLGPNAAAAVCYLAVFLATGHEAHPIVVWSVVLALSGPFWRCFRGLWLLVGLPCGSYLRCAGRPTGEAAWDGLLTHDTAVL